MVTAVLGHSLLISYHMTHINPRAVEVPMKLDFFCHSRWAIRAHCIPQIPGRVAFFHVVDAFYTPTCGFAGHFTCALNIPSRSSQSAH